MPHPLEDWLHAPCTDPVSDISRLSESLHLLDGSNLKEPERSVWFDALLNRTLEVFDALLPRFQEVRLPVSPHTRLLIKTFQSVFEQLFSDYKRFHGAGKKEDADPGGQCLIRQLMLANLTSSLPDPGFWDESWQYFSHGYRRQADRIPREYLALSLLGAIPPSVFSAPEWMLVWRMLPVCSSLAVPCTRQEITPALLENHPFLTGMGDHDAPPILLAHDKPRRHLPEGCHLPINTTKVLAHLDLTERRLRNGPRPNFGPQPLPVPETTISSILGRLATHWGRPKKRRFSRKRPSCRGSLACGIHQIHGLEQTRDTDYGKWIVTNQSAGGYGLMHASGPKQKLRIGSVVAFQIENSGTWQICLVRWALSNNSEHFEIGLEILSSEWSPIIVETSSPPDVLTKQQPGLFLPPLPPIRINASVIVVSSENSPSPQSKIRIGFNGVPESEKSEDFHVCRVIEHTGDTCLIELSEED